MGPNRLVCHGSKPQRTSSLSNGAELTQLPTTQRVLNSQAGPVNTLASRRSPTQQSQKLYHGSGELSTRHRKQLVSPSSARDKPVDLIQDDDSFDARSTSSAETRTLSINPTPRAKRSRLLSQPQIHKVDAKTAHRSRSPAPDSPDVLAVDEPPLTNIASDITPLRKSSKRQVSSDFPDSRVKRSRPNPPVEHIDESEDELQVTQHVKGESGGKRATNFNGVGNRRGNKIALKGDITPSKFVGSKANGSQKSEASVMYLHNAVSGPKFWQAKAGEPARLIANGTADSSELFSLSTDDRAIKLDWLRIISSKLLKVQHAGNHSKYVHVSRNTALPAHHHLYFVALLPEKLDSDLTEP
jgi:hypothetical protein